jgi:hypothetical protein
MKKVSALGKLFSSMLKTVMKLTIRPLLFQITDQCDQVVAMREEHENLQHVHQQRHEFVETHEDPLNVIDVVDDKVKLWQDFEQQTQREDEERAKVYHPFRREAQQGEDFIINFEQFVLLELGEERLEVLHRTGSLELFRSDDAAIKFIHSKPPTECGRRKFHVNQDQGAMQSYPLPMSLHS